MGAGQFWGCGDSGAHCSVSDNEGALLKASGSPSHRAASSHSSTGSHSSRSSRPHGSSHPKYTPAKRRPSERHNIPTPLPDFVSKLQGAGMLHKEGMSGGDELVKRSCELYTAARFKDGVCLVKGLS